MQAGSSGGTQLEFPWCLVRQYAAWSKRLFIQWLRRARPDKPTCPIPGSLSLVNPPPVDPGWSPSHPFLRARRFYRSQEHLGTLFLRPEGLPARGGQVCGFPISFIAFFMQITRLNAYLCVASTTQGSLLRDGLLSFDRMINSKTAKWKNVGWYYTEILW